MLKKALLCDGSGISFRRRPAQSSSCKKEQEGKERERPSRDHENTTTSNLKSKPNLEIFTKEAIIKHYHFDTPSLFHRMTNITSTDRIAYPLQAPPIVQDKMTEIQDLPKHIVHAFQIHQENNIAEEEEESDINYYERNFPIGSLFNFTLQSTSLTLEPSDNAWDVSINPASFHIGEGAQLILQSAAIDPSFSRKNGNLSLFVSTDVNPDYTCICPFISRTNPVHSLCVSVIGPALVQFALVDHYDYDEESASSSANNTSGEFHTVNIFGKVELCKPDVQELVLKAKQEFLQLKENADVDDSNDEEMECVLEEMNKEKTPEKPKKEVKKVKDVPKKEVKNVKGVVKSPQKEVKKVKDVPKKDVVKSPHIVTKKRKLSSDAAEEQQSQETSSPSSAEPKKLTKKQRKKQAEQKGKELQKVIAKENNHEAKKPEKKQDGTKLISLTRPRMVETGIVVQDIIHGTGSTVRKGRKVAINYVGTFPESEKVFDKNNSKSNPLTFRIGTREVIKGLDRGMEGMKVGGERIITVSPEMGYGRKGTGIIPGNATLCFSVQLQSVGK